MKRITTTITKISQPKPKFSKYTTNVQNSNQKALAQKLNLVDSKYKVVEVDFFECRTERETRKNESSEAGFLTKSTEKICLTSPNMNCPEVKNNGEVIKICETECSGSEKDRMSPQLKGSLNSHLKYAVKTEMLEECNEVQNIVRNSVESVTKMLSHGPSSTTATSYKLPSPDEPILESSLRSDYSSLRNEEKKLTDGPKTSRTIINTSHKIGFHQLKKKTKEDFIPRKVIDCPIFTEENNISRHKSPISQSTKSFIPPKKPKISTPAEPRIACDTNEGTLEVKIVPYKKASPEKNCEFKYTKFGPKLLAIYKGWKTRKVYKSKEAQGFIIEINKVKSKLNIIKGANQSGKHVLNNVLNFKKQQLKNLFESKLPHFYAEFSTKKTADLLRKNSDSNKKNSDSTRKSVSHKRASEDQKMYFF